jgi:general secretion pathway protein D
LRSVDNVKATLKIGDREPIATGSYQAGTAATAINALVNTQFQYLDVGVNVDLTPHVHDNGDVSMHVDIEISNVNGHVNLGGIDQPIIGQRKVTHDIRMKEGEVGLLGGLINQQDTKTVTGIPGLASIPLLRRLFTGESVEHQRSELMIALIPHVIRRQEINPSNLRTIAVGNQTSVHLNYEPLPATVEQGTAAVAPSQESTPAAPPAIAAPPAAVPPAAVPPATAPPANVPAAPGAPPATAPAAPGAPPATAPPATAPRAEVEQPKGNVKVQFLPGTVNTAVSSSFAVGVVIQGDDIAATPMQIQFDPKLLRLNDVTRGNFFSQDGQQPAFTKNIQNDTGTASVQLNRASGTPGVSGIGTVVTLNFQATGRGNTTVSIPSITVRNSQGQVVGTSGPQQLVVNVK